MLIKGIEHIRSSKSLSVPYRGIVKVNVDPRRLGRIKVEIKGKFESSTSTITNEDGSTTTEDNIDSLPWCFPHAPTESGGRANSSSLEVPEIGSEVVIEFKYGDIYHPFYTGRWISDHTVTADAAQDSPNTIIKNDSSGNQEKTNKKLGTKEFVHSSGTRQKYSADGTHTTTSKKCIRLESNDGKTSVDVNTEEGTITIDSKTSTKFTGNAANIETDELNINSGNIRTELSGSHEETIAGGKKTLVGGGESHVVAGNYGESIAGNKDSLVAGLTNETYGGQKKTTVVAGGVLETLLLGNHDLQLTLGNIVRTIAAGNYECNVVAGNIVLSTLLGQVNLSNTLADISLDPSGGISIKALSTMKFAATATMDFVAPMISINKLLGGFAVSTLSDPVEDFVTGKPKLGVPTVIIG